MFTKKLLSNSIEVLKLIPETDCGEHTNLDSEELPSEK